jgi:hypothetical protein
MDIPRNIMLVDAIWIILKSKMLLFCFKKLEITWFQMMLSKDYINYNRITTSSQDRRQLRTNIVEGTMYRMA